MLEPNAIYEMVKCNSDLLCHNEILIDIFEGNLLTYIAKDMDRQFDDRMLKDCMARVVPINILPKIIDKLTNIYQTTVTREVFNGAKKDEDLLAWYIDKLDINAVFNDANEMFNLTKTALIQPFVYDKQPCVRVILSDKFVVYSTNPVKPAEPTGIILLMGKRDDVDIYYHYTADKIEAIDSRGDIRRDIMEEMGNPDGVNPIGRLPFTYVNQSRYRVRPKPDSDILQLTKVIPIMFTDLNVAAMYQSFSIIYGIDINDENLKMSPNAFWSLKSDITTDTKPEIGMLKPAVDYSQVIQLIETQLSLWMGTKGIRASTVGSLTSDNYASGLSKVIDEMDTYEAREKQVGYFEAAERDFWSLTLQSLHPYWVQSGQIDNRTLFDPTASVRTSFATQLPTQSRGDVVRDLRDERDAGFISRKRAMAKINPEMSSRELDELMQEIDEEKEEAATFAVTSGGITTPDEEQAIADDEGENV